MAEALVFEHLNKEEWFKPNETRETSEKILKDKNIGAFVVRNSSKKDHYALSYKNRDGHITHSLIQKTASGYRIPGEDQVFPTLIGLLMTCKFLSIAHSQEAIDKNIATLSEAFPDIPLDQIRKALTSTNNDANQAIDFLLNAPPESTRNAQNVAAKPTAVIPPASNAKPTSNGVHANQPNSNAKPAEPVIPLRQTFGMNHVTEILYQQIADNKGQIEVIQKGWWNLKPATTAEFNASEARLQKLLFNASTKLGKKISEFVHAFSNNYSGPVAQPQRYPQLVKDVRNHIQSMQELIAKKVPEFAQSSASLWKVIEGATFPGIFTIVKTYFLTKYVEVEVNKASIIQNAFYVDIAQSEISPKFRNVDYSKAVNSLRQISAYYSLHQKIFALIDTLNAIREAAGDIERDDLLAVFTFVLCKTQMPNAYTELMLAKEFLVTPLNTGLEGYAIAVFESALLQIDVLLSVFNAQSLNKPEVHTAEAKEAQSPWMFPIQTSPQYETGNVQYAYEVRPEEDKFRTLFRAEETFIKNLLESPPTTNGELQIATYFFNHGDLDAAIEHATNALHLDPNNLAAKSYLYLYNKQRGLID